MSDKLAKVSNIVLYILLAVSVVIGVVFYIKNGQMSSEASFEVQGEQLGIILEYFMYWAYGLLISGAILAVFFGFAGMASNPKSAVKSLISIAIVGVVIGIAYVLGSSETTEVLNLTGYTGLDNTIGKVTFAATGLYTMYFLMGAAFFAAIAAEVIKVFK